MHFDGKTLLSKTIERAGYSSIEQIVAEMTLFAHPETVRQTKNKNLFRVVRNSSDNRGKAFQYEDSVGQVVACDNQTPANAFRWAIPDGLLTGEDIQYNHIYSDSKNVDTYTCLANLCVTPSFLAKLTDKDDRIKILLRYRAFDLYGFHHPAIPPPERPDGYSRLAWLEFPKPITDVESAFRSRMKDCPKSRASISARTIGWFFSDFSPDQTI